MKKKKKKKAQSCLGLLSTTATCIKSLCIYTAHNEPQTPARCTRENTALTQEENSLFPALAACIYFYACVCNQKHAKNFLFASPGEIPLDLKSKLPG